MSGKELFERWIAIHTPRFFERYSDREITDQRVFEYVDTVHSNVLKVLLENFSLENLLRDFKIEIEEYA
jgi:hypothetical protein